MAVPGAHGQRYRWRHSWTSAAAMEGSRSTSAKSSNASDWMEGLGVGVSDADPFSLVVGELDRLTEALLSTVRVLQLPALDAAAAHLLSLHGKRVRPTIVLLMAQAAAAGSMSGAPVLLPTQRRLAEITELIHAASLLHDDVIDGAATRRGAPSANAAFGNQLAVLAGDFLLARASVALARLRDCDVVERLATVIEHLVRGEVLQMRAVDKASPIASARGPATAAEGDAMRAKYHAPEGAFEVYLSKTFFKTASLIANSARAVCMLGWTSDAVADAAYTYGEHVGIAFQLIDDVLDVSGSANALGKPVGDDMRQGHATAPVLFALQAFPDEVRPLIERRFAQAGDVDSALQLIQRADGVGQTRALAQAHARVAVKALLDNMQASAARNGLINLAGKIVTRDR